MLAVQGLSMLAMCAPSDKFLYMGGPLAMGLGVVFVSSIGLYKYVDLISPYVTLPSGWAGCYTCPALRPYQFGPMRCPDVTRRSQ